MKIVIKIGTSSITNNSKVINFDLIAEIARISSQLKKLGHQVVIVSSGSIGLGCHKLGWSERPNSIIQKQATASIGQILLAQAYQEYFDNHDEVIGQVLLTRRGMQDLERFLNARLTITELLSLNTIPIVNENDVIADEEIRFSDNDYLAAVVAQMIAADHLFMLTDQDGLYTANPDKDPSATLISEIDEITEEIESIAGGSSQWGTGGMYTKIQAAKIATATGTTTHIISGSKPESIEEVIVNNTQIGTRFLAHQNPQTARESWIAYAIASSGILRIREESLDINSGLMVSDLVSLEGEFSRGQAVEIISEDNIIAKGISMYSSVDLQKVLDSEEANIEKILGYTYGRYAITKEDLVKIN